MQRPGDCLATALAAMLDLDATELPWTGAPDWQQAWRLLRTELWRRGWQISYTEWFDTDPRKTLADVLAYAAGDGFDTIDNDLMWLVSVDHPSFVGESGEVVAHVIVVKGADVVFDPGGDVMKRPPLDELRMRAFFMLTPLDPAAWQRRSYDQGWNDATLVAQQRIRILEIALERRGPPSVTVTTP